MKTVTDKYLEMNHNFIELRDSIFQKVKDENKDLTVDDLEIIEV